jgi:hypothetical protein
MPTIPPGVQLLYTHNLTPYTQRSYSNTAREFVADPLLQPETVAFEPHCEWLTPQFQVDTTLE